jgi:hypothetical protein
MKNIKEDTDEFTEEYLNLIYWFLDGLVLEKSNFWMELNKQFSDHNSYLILSAQIHVVSSSNSIRLFTTFSSIMKEFLK